MDTGIGWGGNVQMGCRSGKVTNLLVWDIVLLGTFVAVSLGDSGTGGALGPGVEWWGCCSCSVLGKWVALGVMGVCR